MSEWLKVIILGIVEGLTEFLPISSTGHLILVDDFLQFDSIAGNVFEIFIQIGAVVAILVYYRHQLSDQLRKLLSDDPEQRGNARQLWLGIVIAFIPAAVIGLLFDDLIEAVLFNPLTVALALIVGGVMFILVETLIKPQETSQIELDAQPLSLKQAFLVGCWQVLALIPGMSRSGMSIIGAMVTGIDRRRATEFSFYLAIPTLGAATLYTLLKQLNELSSDSLLYLAVGTLVSGIIAWLSIGWLLRYVSNNNFIPFGYYRIILGIIIIVTSFVMT